MKQKLIGILVLICLFFCSCAGKDKAPAVEPAEEYLIPNSYFTYTGAEIESAVQAYTELGAEYCTSAEAISDGMRVVLTKNQRDNLIKRNDDYAKELLSSLLNENEEYHYLPDEACKKLVLYFDEKASMMAQADAIFGASTVYGLNQILLTNDPDWSVEITIYNCHTEKQVVTMRIPVDHVSFGPEEWRKSYEE